MGWTKWEKVPGFDNPELLYWKKYHTELEGGVARISINRPEVYNAGGGSGAGDRGRAMRDAADDPRVGIIILTGEGGHFGTGGDVRHEATPEFATQMTRERRPEEGDMMSFTIKCPKIFIAVVQGFCIGNSYHEALQCDFTIAGESAIFGHNGARVGSPRCDFSIALEAITVGMKRAKELNMLLPRWTAHEAYEMGLVNKVVADDKLEEEVDKWCEKLFMVSPTCIRLRKIVLNTWMDMILDSLGRHGNMVNKFAPGFMESEERKECLGAFFSRPRRLPQSYAKHVEEVKAGAKRP